LRKIYQRREDPHGDKSGKRSDKGDKSSREKTSMVNVISGGLAFGGDTKQAHRSHQYKSKFSSIMNVERKQPNSDEAISFSEKDR
jgi:hypothetical protein